MSAHETPPAPHFAGWNLHLLHLSKAFALAGGVLFLGMIALSLVSIVGRKLWAAPIHGDYELLQMGSAIASAAFFPFCTMMNENLRVEFFTERLSPRRQGALDGIANLMLGVAMVLLAWRTGIRAQEVLEAGEVSTMRNIPIWIPVVCLVPSLALTALCAFNRAAHHFLAHHLSARSVAP